MTSIEKVKRYLRGVFYGRHSTPTVMSDLLFAANIFIILVSIVGLVLDTGRLFVYIEFLFGVFFALEYVLRFWISRHKRAYMFRMVNVLDLLVIGSLLMTPFAPSLAFLRILRALQILRAYNLSGKRFDHHNDFLHRNFEVMTALVNISVFLAIMSTVVYVQQAPINEGIVNYVDALYFTIAAVTTTGFGDIVVVGSFGKVLSIIIMILGVTLFFRLIKSVFVPHRLYVVCSGCGHDAHQLDAHFCSNCGHKIKNKLRHEHYQKHKDDF